MPHNTKACPPNGARIKLFRRLKRKKKKSISADAKSSAYTSKGFFQRYSRDSFARWPSGSVSFRKKGLSHETSLDMIQNISLDALPQRHKGILFLRAFVSSWQKRIRHNARPSGSR